MTFFTFSDSGDVRRYENFTLLPDRYISVNGEEPQPIEDFGNYLLTDQTLTDLEAWDRWLNLI